MTNFNLAPNLKSRMAATTIGASAFFHLSNLLEGNAGGPDEPRRTLLLAAESLPLPFLDSVD